MITFFAVTLGESTRQMVLKSYSGDAIARLTRHAVPILPEDVRTNFGKYIDEFEKKLDPNTPPETPDAPGSDNIDLKGLEDKGRAVEQKVQEVEKRDQKSPRSAEVDSTGRAGGVSGERHFFTAKKAASFLSSRFFQRKKSRVGDAFLQCRSRGFSLGEKFLSAEPRREAIAESDFCSIYLSQIATQNGRNQKPSKFPGNTGYLTEHKKHYRTLRGA